MKRTAAAPGKARTAEGVAGVLKALADPIRLRILCLLAEGELCVCDLHGSLAVPQPTVSRHLAYLRSRGLVEARREGVWMHYRLSPALEEDQRSLLSAVIRVAGSTRAASRDREVLRGLLDCCPPPNGRTRPPASGSNQA